MAGETQDNTWPLPKFYFSVRFGDDAEILFQDVSGLDTETDVIAYRHGDSSVFGPIKMPGVKKFSNVTMKKGVFKRDNKFWDWFSQIKMNTIKRRTVTVTLLDEAGAPKFVWTLHDAWPTKITGTDLKSTGSEVAVETVEMAFERVDMKNA